MRDPVFRFRRDSRYHPAMLLFLLACDPDKQDSEACLVQDLSVDRLDVPTGYRVVETPVSASWLAEDRTVPVGIWYPTAETEGEGAVFIDMFPDANSLVDASFSDPVPDCKLPLIVYSHGSQAWGGSNSPLLRHLVAQGWVAAAPDHVGNTLSDNVDPRPVTFSLTRVADIRATIDAIENLPEGDPLYGRVDTSKVLVMGHSYGGQTSWLLTGPTLDSAALNSSCDNSELGCTEAERAAFEEPMTDDRIVAAMPLDGFAGSDIVGASGWETADLPILYLSQAGDDASFTTAGAYTNLIWAPFEGSCHETFNNSPIQCETFDKAEGLDLTAAFMSAFAAVHILDRPEEEYLGILQGTTSLDDRITVHRSATASP